jgi:hypothetical protein
VTRLGVFSGLETVSAEEGPSVAASPFLTGPLYAQALKTAWLAALSLADGLAFLSRGLVILIIAGFGAAILQVRGVAIVCQEGVDLLLGRFAKRLPGTAGFDFTPLIFLFGINLMYTVICQVLVFLIQTPWLN